MADQFSPRIAACTECSNHICLFFNRVGSGNGKNKCHNGNDHIKKNDHHGPVTAYVLPGKINGLIFETRDVILKGNFLIDRTHQIL